MKDILIILAFLLAMLLVLGKLLERRRTFPQLFTILLLLNFAFYHLISYLLYCPHPFEIPWLGNWAFVLEAAGFMLFLFKGPTHYGYCYSVVTAGKPFPVRYLLHFIPGLVYAAVYLPLAWIKTSAARAADDASLFFPGHDTFYITSILLCVIVYDIYLVMSIIKLYPMVRKFPTRNFIFKFMLGSYAAGIATTSFWPVDILMNAQFTSDVRVGSLIYLVIIYIISCRYPERMISDAYEEKKHYNKTQLQGVDVQSVITRLDRIMKEEKLYKKDLSLAMLAATLDLRQHQLSEILNLSLKTTFIKYINDLRVEESTLLLETRPDLQIIEISLETGYNSLSVFYREFKKRTGISPAEYRRKKNGA